MNTVTIKRSHLTIILIAVAFLLILVMAQYLQRPMSPVTPDAITFLETLREAPAATIVSRDGSLQVFSGGSDPTPIEKCGLSQGPEIPAGCKPHSLEHPVNHNVMELTIYKGKPGSSEAAFFIATQGSTLAPHTLQARRLRTSYHRHCPGKSICDEIAPQTFR
jgi:hypothetical protein